MSRGVELIQHLEIVNWSNLGSGGWLEERMGKQSEQGYQKNIHEKGQQKSELFGEQRIRIPPLVYLFFNQSQE